MSDGNAKVEFFGLTTCGWCKKTKQWLDDHQVAYECVYVDELHGEDREKAKERVMEFVSRLAFPIVIIGEGDAVIQGFKPDQFEEKLG